MKQEHFEFNELPYQTLARFGLTQEMIEDLPMRVLDEIGRRRLFSGTSGTCDRDENGELSRAAAALPLSAWKCGAVDVVFYPALEVLTAGTLRREPAETAAGRQDDHCRCGDGGRTLQQGIRTD